MVQCTEHRANGGSVRRHVERVDGVGQIPHRGIRQRRHALLRGFVWMTVAERDLLGTLAARHQLGAYRQRAPAAAGADVEPAPIPDRLHEGGESRCQRKVHAGLRREDVEHVGGSVPQRARHPGLVFQLDQLQAVHRPVACGGPIITDPEALPTSGSPVAVR